MAASEELVGNDPKKSDTNAVPGHGEPRSGKARAEDLAQVFEEENRDDLADAVRNEHLSTLPVFWDGTPGTLAVGMVCREGKESSQVQAIVPCVNGTVILGVVVIDGQIHNFNITQPRKHPLSDVADETERRKLWEYDQL